YLRMKDFDEEGGTNQIISRDGFLQFPDGPVAIGNYSNNNAFLAGLSPAPAYGDLVLEGLYLFYARRDSFEDIIFQSERYWRNITSTGGCETVVETKTVTGCINREAVMVNMMGYSFNYNSGDAHIDNVSVSFSKPLLTWVDGVVSFSIYICYYENAANENYSAYIYYTVLCW
ncbi:hypothetical protein ACFL2J_01810, partial [Candidatus Omnitrophota bacterium]